MSQLIKSITHFVIAFLSLSGILPTSHAINGLLYSSFFWFIFLPAPPLWNQLHLYLWNPKPVPLADAPMCTVMAFPQGFLLAASFSKQIHKKKVKKYYTQIATFSFFFPHRKYMFGLTIQISLMWPNVHLWASPFTFVSLHRTAPRGRRAEHELYCSLHAEQQEQDRGDIHRNAFCTCTATNLLLEISVGAVWHRGF